MSQGTETLKRTPLHDRHVAAGARLVPFAGWEMPVQYAGIREEHRAVRTSVGIFDVSHMGEIETDGPGAEAFLQHILSNDVTKIAEDSVIILQSEQGSPLEGHSFLASWEHRRYGRNVLLLWQKEPSV